MNRLDRLTAILIHLQTKRVVRAQELADRFHISLRTVYRDVRSLEEAGVPIGAEAGVGYFLTDYHLPPVMFTTAEASALLLGGKLIEKWADESVRTRFESALYKIKSVLKRTDQEHLDDLDAHIDVAKPVNRTPYSNDLLNDIQQAIARHHVLALQYHSQYNDAETQREVEPVGLYHYRLGWHLIAFCRKRQDYRDFRVDRIRQLTDTGESYSRRNRLTLQEYLDRMGTTDMPTVAVTVVFNKSTARYLQEQKHAYGFQHEDDLGDSVRMHFQTPYAEGLARWLLMYGRSATVEQPDMIRNRVLELVEEIQAHYAEQAVDELP
ncbi:helix-turn-helix transcriptional regulator [Spirosoma pollinicola]|uniref:DNA-binding transcriptional regulator n=1 Tax=Spirosoma pollinicola TaxID=2057025 RepID=A0A2K8YVC7_9BACT|nr:YafY family protein [Spirosoma pollinicola]AUD01573.1 DNA-binding transcriptional regulator [Spirosoma pollinicola]